MLMLENNYPEYKLLNHWVLKPIVKDLNSFSNMKLTIQKKGRPADTLIFQCILDKQIDLVTELSKDNTTRSVKSTGMTIDSILHTGLIKTLIETSSAQIQLSKFETKFMQDMQSKYDLNGSFSWLTAKQRVKLETILAKYGQI
ncbi:hypothetical protein [Xenorhabdus aichiensis]|uniref:hypothetical protein n=1 Tax=Xenorhabdus aichiensis TaxID=3025874 RepID=UPI00351E717F